MPEQKTVFISYPSESWNFAQRIAKDLESHLEQPIFIDTHSIDQSNFREAIINNLRNSSVMILIVTQYTFEDINADDDWVRLEIRTALENKIPIVLACEGDCSLPEKLPPDVHDVQDQHGIDFPRNYYASAIDRLVNFLVRLKVTTRKLNVPQSVIAPSQLTKSTSGVISSIDFLPQPFKWIDISAGKVTLANNGIYSSSLRSYPHGTDKTFDVPAFSMSQYPITNSQFAEFVRAGSYTKREYWTDAGWNERRKLKLIEPYYKTWRDKQWNNDTQPVVGIKWYEAVAFCLWLSQLTGETVMLPTEQQWQRAAQGDDGRVYPWGNNWEESLCRNRVGKHKETLQNTGLVTDYDPGGNSPFGVSDMSGNVWEWCVTNYETGSIDIEAIKRADDKIALRGGSWRDDKPEYFECSYRSWSNPDHFDVSIGFRICRPRID